MPELQYAIELTAAGCIDNPANHTMGVQERLEILRTLQTSWKQPVFSPRCRCQVDVDSAGLRQFGSVFSGTRTILCPRKRGESLDSRSWNTMTCLSTRSDLDTGVQWTLDFDFSFEAYTLDVSRDLLVLLHWARRRPTTEDWCYK